MINIPRLDINDAYTLIEGARIKANEMGIPMCIAVSDDSGNLIAFERMDGAKAHSIMISQDKAYTGGAARKATHEYNAVNTPGNLAFGIDTECGGRISTVGGGYPIMVDGSCLGGVGTSGGTPAQDMEVSEAAIEHFQANS
ncbi:MAG: heme-binding protein [Cocleimonas sp.]